MGIYYIAPLLGPSLGSILGGGLTTAFTWRGPFYFLAIMGGVVFMSFLLFFRDTFRHERSHTYQSVLKARLKEAGPKKNVGVEDIDADNAAQDIEKQEVSSKPVVAPDVKLGLVDVNPFRPMAFILRRKYNLFMLTASGTDCEPHHIFMVSPLPRSLLFLRICCSIHNLSNPRYLLSL